MSDIMRPIPFGDLMNWAMEEYRKSGSLFGVPDPVKHTNGQALPIYGEKIEAPTRSWPRTSSPPTRPGPAFSS